MTVQWDAVMDTFFVLAWGVPLTLGLASGGIFIGFLLGGLFNIVAWQYKGWGRWIIERYVFVFRSTPLLLQIAFFYFVIPVLTGVAWPAWVAGVITLGLNSSAYIYGALKSGLNGIPQTQWEAAQGVGIRRLHIWKDIIIPQAIALSRPALVNECVCLTKETALVSTIGVAELMRLAQQHAIGTYDYFTPLCVAGFYYALLVWGIEKVAQSWKTPWVDARR